MSELLLDTDVLIDVQRGHPPAVAWFGGLADTPSVPGFAVMELMQSARNKRELQASLRVVQNLPVVWPSAYYSDVALTAFRQFHLSHGLGLLDALIGATAIDLDADLCTFNARHFRVIPGVRLLQPYSR